MSRSERRGFLEASLSSAAAPYITNVLLDMRIESMESLGILGRVSIDVEEPCLQAREGSYENKGKRQQGLCSKTNESQQSKNDSTSGSFRQAMA